MNQYRVIISDPVTDGWYGEQFITTDDEIEAFFWVQDMVMDYSEHYNMRLIATVEVM